MSIIAKGQTIHCNRCDKAFDAPQNLKREMFCGQQAARIQEFCTCPHCEQTDGHWLFASDVMPEFTGGFDARKRLQRDWLKSN